MMYPNYSPFYTFKTDDVMSTKPKTYLFDSAKDAFEFRDQWERMHPDDSIKVLPPSESMGVTSNFGIGQWKVKVF